MVYKNSIKGLNLLLDKAKDNIFKKDNSQLIEYKKKSYDFIRKNRFSFKNNEKYSVKELSDILKFDFSISQRDKNSDKSLLPNLRFNHTLVFVNGFFEDSLSDYKDIDNNIEIEIIEDNCDLSEFSNDDISDNFIHLNNLLFERGIILRVKENIFIKNPIHIIHIDNENSFNNSQYPQKRIIIENGAKAAIIEEFYSAEQKNTFINSFTDIILEEDSELSFTLLENSDETRMQISSIRAKQLKSSRFSSNTINFGNRFTRNNIFSKLLEENAECEMNGLYIIENNNYLNNFTGIEHIAPNCESSQLFNGILSDISKAVFTGNIKVYQNAQNTISKQSNNSLMLSNTAYVDAKPQLEIFADDVQCSHSATIGQLEDDELYYLMSRGIEKSHARSMLTLAFTQKITEKIENIKIKNLIEDLILKKMKSTEEK